MQAMIFAAGLGTRLKPYTEQHPKALIPVCGIPILQRVIKNIAAAGVEHIVINVHHFADQIENFLKANHNFGVDISVSDERALLLDTGGGLLQAAPLFSALNHDEPVLLHNADILTDLPISQIFKQHTISGADVTLLCSHRNSSRTLWFDKDDRLCGWENSNTHEYRPSGFSPSPCMHPSPFDGIHVVSPKIFPLLSDYNTQTATGEQHTSDGIHPFSIVPFYLANLSKLNIRRFLLPEMYSWFDIGSTTKLAAAEAAMHDRLLTH